MSCARMQTPTRCEPRGDNLMAKTLVGKPHIIVVGLTGKQKRIVVEQCGKIARLAFVPSSRASTHYSQSVDFVVLSRFVPHRFSVAAWGLPRLYCGGGLTAICRAISRFVADWTRR
jgi:hypothetical protein